MKPSEILEKAKALIADQKNWIKGAWARDAKSRAIDFVSTDACQFCSAGAVLHISAKEATADEPVYNDAINILQSCIAGMAVVDWNDMNSRTHAEVMDLFDRAIAKAKEKENGY